MPKIIPFGNRILVRRRKIGDKLGKSGLIVAADETKDRDTDLADVVYIPDQTFADKEIMHNAEEIIVALIKTAKEGNAYSVNTLMELNNFLKLKSIQVGDGVFISKYVGTSFGTSDSQEELVVVNLDDVIGLIAK